MVSLKTAWVSIIASVFVLGCSDTDKSPPDDDGEAQHLGATKLSTCSQEEFRACAEAVLGNSGLSEAEVASLVSCGFREAKALTSSPDRFAVAQAAVKAQCE